MSIGPLGPISTIGHLYHERATEDPRIYNARWSKRTNPDSSEQIGYTNPITNSDGSVRELFVEFKPTNDLLVDLSPIINANRATHNARRAAARRAAKAAAPSLLKECQKGVLAACTFLGIGGRRTKRAKRAKRAKRRS